MRRSIAEIIGDAKERFGSNNVERASGFYLPARIWAIRTARAAGHTHAAIAEAFHTLPHAVQAAIGDDPDLDPDEDCHPEMTAPVRMLPVLGDRYPCAHEGACLAELLRACAPRAPAYASCPPGCPSRVRYVAEGASTRGLGSWSDSVAA
jgi:hypothetical protein